MKPQAMTEIIRRKRYDTETATLIAGDDYWDGHNWERRGRNQFLYRTPRGNYFYVTLTQRQGERNTLTPLTADEAMSAWERMPERRVLFADAFPGAIIEEA
jgi:hypothetical protein